MRILTTLALTLSLSGTLSGTAAAQANDYGGLRIFTASGGAPPALICGNPFTCTPTSFMALANENVQALLHGTLNGLFILAASVDTQPTCIPLGIPGVVNDLALNPGLLTTLAVGVCSQGDNGRCNGGFELVPLFQVPSGLPPISLKFQALLSSPTGGGGSVLAFSNPVIMNL